MLRREARDATKGSFQEDAFDMARLFLFLRTNELGFLEDFGTRKVFCIVL